MTSLAFVDIFACPVNSITSEMALSSECVLPVSKYKCECVVAAASLAMLAQSVQGVQGDLLEAIPKLLHIMTSAADALQVSSIKLVM